MWSTEKQFGKFVMDKMKKEGMTPIRIESASTISGMPDIYVLGYNNDWFIELKNIKNKSVDDTHWKIQWRPGQQAWSQEYLAHHTTKVSNKFLSTKYSWTFVGLLDGVLFIRMSSYRQDNEVYSDDCSVFTFTLDEFRELNIGWFLRTHSQVVTPILNKNMTWGQFIYKQLKFDIEEVLGHYYDDVDMPAPADIVHEVAPGLVDKLTAIITPSEWCADIVMGWRQRRIAEQACLIYRSYLNK